MQSWDTWIHCLPASIVRQRQELIAKTMAGAKDRLTKEFNYWDYQAEDLKLQEAEKPNPKINSAKARQRANDLEARLLHRLQELEQERTLALNKRTCTIDERYA